MVIWKGRQVIIVLTSPGLKWYQWSRSSSLIHSLALKAYWVYLLDFWHSYTKWEAGAFDKQLSTNPRKIFNSCIISHFDIKICVQCIITYQGPGGYLKKAIELRNLRALKYSTLYEIVSFNVWVTYYVWNLISVLSWVRADSRFVPSQWETSIQSNAVSHWLGANLESAP